MILVVDTGNTFIKFVLFKDDKIVRSFKRKTGRRIKFAFLKKFKIEKIIYSNVAKRYERRILRGLRRYFKCDLISIEDLKNSIKMTEIIKKNNKYIGADLIANLQSYICDYKGPGLIIDVGTITKLLFLDKNNVFTGCVFLLSPYGCLKAMYNDTSLLPYIKIKKTKKLFGFDTETSINCGGYNGFIFQMQGFIDYFKKEYKNINIIFTGGGHKIFEDHFKDYLYDPYFTIKGIYYIYKENLKNE